MQDGRAPKVGDVVDVGARCVAKEEVRRYTCRCPVCSRMEAFGEDMDVEDKLGYAIISYAIDMLCCGMASYAVICCVIVILKVSL